MKWFNFKKKEKTDTISGKEVIQIKVVSDQKCIDSYREALTLYEEVIKVVAEFDTGVVGRKYIYCPKKTPLDFNQFMQAAHSLMTRKFDYIIVSKTLDTYPIAGCDCVEDALIYDAVTCMDGIQSIRNNSSLKGKVLRLPGYEEVSNTMDFSELIPNVRLIYESFLVDKDDATPEYVNYDITKSHKKEKKLVFVMPIFMAVGGVERNTIEIMRALQEKYEFVVITMERHSKGQGSLNHQLNNLCIANYDLREIVEFQEYLSELEKMRNLYKPDIIWLCNNSPWLEENMLSFRKVFENQRIVAQDVYDTEYGWIAYYNTEGMQSVDGYIAINAKIEKAFIEKYNIPEKDIEIIYPAIDDKKVRKTIQENRDRKYVCEKYDLDESKKHMVLIGRMMEQKNPIRYLELIRAVKDNYKDIQFLIVGDGNLGEQVDEYIISNGLSENVKRIKYVDNVPELYQGMDGLILTSVYEGLPIVSIEAMCMGVPILSTDVGDLKIFIDKYNGGIIMDDERTDEENFVYWMNNYDEYKQNAVNNSKEILEFFSANNIAQKYIDIFEKNV